MAFLPITKEEMVQRGWDQADFVLVTGDAYVDHPSFGAAIISRVLEDEGFRVAVLPQPDWRCDRDFMRFGRPRLAFLVTAGNIDSMVAIIPPPKESAATMRIPRETGRENGRTGLVLYTAVNVRSFTLIHL